MVEAMKSFDSECGEILLTPIFEINHSDKTVSDTLEIFRRSEQAKSMLEEIAHEIQHDACPE